MKQKLLLFAVAFLCSVGVWAQTWTASAVGAGDFFLYNVGAEKFLTGGHLWGTHASLDEHGLYCTLTASSGAYTIKTGNNKYLGSDAHVDNGTSANWTFAAVPGQTNTYTIYNSSFGGYLVATDGSTDLSKSNSSPSNNFGYWKLASREAMQNAVNLRIADEDHPVDMTFLLKSVNFVRGTDGWLDHSNTSSPTSGSVSGGWAYEANQGNFVFCGPNAETQTNTGCEMWNNTFDINQTVDVPNGKYYVTCDGFGSSNTRIYAGEVESAFTKTGNVDGHTFSQAMLNIGSYKEGGKSGVVTVKNGSLKVGVKRSTNAGSEWTVIDNFRLYSIGNSLSVVCEPAAFINGNSATAEKWYAFTISSNGWYTITPSSAVTFSYTQDGTMPFDSDFPRFYASTTGKKQYLTAGTFYFQTTTTATVTIVATSISANDDLTYLLTNPSFEDGNMNGWTTICGNNVVDPSTLSDCGVKSVTDPTYPFTNYDGDYLMNYYGWSWSCDPINGIRQPISLPAGNYRIEAVLGGWEDWKMVLDVNGTYQEKSMTAENVGESFLVDISLATPSILIITAKTYYTSNTWRDCFMKADNFRLYSLDHYYDALNAAITAAETHTLGFEIGEYAPYENVDAIIALNNAKAVNQANYDISWSELQTIVSELTSATWTANTELMDAIYDGQFASYDEGDLDRSLMENSIKFPGGWLHNNDATSTRDHIRQIATFSSFTGGRAMFFHPGYVSYGNSTGYTMPLKANSVYKFSFQYAGWGAYGTNAPSVSILNESGEGKTLSALPEGGPIPSSGATRYTVYFATDATPGNYTLKYQSPEDTNSTIGDLSLIRVDALTLDQTSAVNYVAGTYPTVELNRSFSTTNYSTLALPFAMTSDQTSAAFDEVYVFNAVDGNSLKFATAFSINAGTPYLVKAKSSTLSVSNVAIDPSTPVSNVTKSDASSTVTFQGTFSPIAALEKDGSRYVVSSNNLYQVNSTVGLDGYRAYFISVAVPSAKSFVLNFDDVDMIQTVEAAQSESSVIYNLAGQRLSKAQKGVNIINGKKVLVK